MGRGEVQCEVSWRPGFHEERGEEEDGDREEVVVEHGCFSLNMVSVAEDGV